MSQKPLNETASAGAIGASSIAVNIGGSAKEIEKRSFKNFLKNFQKNVVNNKGAFKPVKPFAISINESFDLQDVLSRLTGMESKTNRTSRDSTTYGVEDDEGNIMKVTVPKDQAEEFEVYLAHKLAELEEPNTSGATAKSVSMAELLFNLKDKFTIIDVDFPNIPTDVVYNADKATTQAGTDTNPLNTDMIPDNPSSEMGGEMGGEGMDDLPPVKNSNGPMDLNNMDDSGSMDGTENPLGNESGAEGDDLGDLADIEGDAEGVEDFIDTGDDEGSILDKVIGMLKSQADAEAAKANAEAEKYRAEQAAYSAKAASATLAQEEEVAQMELQMDREKDADKQAKKLADIARWRASRASGNSLTEAEANESSLMVRRLISQLPQTWATSPDDDEQTKRYKQAQMINDRRALSARLASARLREQEARRLKSQGKDGNMDKNIQQQQNQQQNQQQAGNIQ